MLLIMVLLGRLLRLLGFRLRCRLKLLPNLLLLRLG